MARGKSPRPRLAYDSKPQRPGGAEGKTLAISFRYLVPSTYDGVPAAAFFIHPLARFKAICSHSPSECFSAHRHSMIGTELLPPAQFRGDVQRASATFDAEATRLLVFRAAGDNRAMVGILEGAVFFVMGIEGEINSLYRHN